MHSLPDTLKKFIQELQRRNVIKSALAYLVVAWLITQVMAILIPTFELPVSLLKTSILVLTLGFPFWLIFSWIYEITPDGLKKTKNVIPEHSIAGKTSNRLNYVIIASLVIAIGLLIRNSFFTPANAVNELELATVAIDKSIAVLAFVDMSPEKDQEYFSDGISEEILNLLVKIPELKVISRTSSFSYKGKDVKIKKIGEELHVGHVLEGSIRKAGNTFRITAQLIDANTGVHIWSETYDRDMEDIFMIQDEIATMVTQQLKVSLFGISLTSAKVNTDAYNLFLQANKVSRQGSSESNTNGIKLIKESIAIDSTYAPAWSLLGNLIYSAGTSYAIIPRSDALKQGKLAAKKAIALDPEYVFSYMDLAKIEHDSWNFKEASHLMDKAMRLGQNNADVMHVQSHFAVQSGKLDLAITLMLKIIELAPLNEYNKLSLGFYYWLDGQFGKAEESFNKFLFLRPNYSHGNVLMGDIQLSLGHPEKALVYIEKQNEPFWTLYGKNLAVYAMGKTQEANDLLEQLITDWGDMAWPNIAYVHAFRSEKDEAFKWLELALKNKDASLFEVLNYPQMRNLWGDPRWNNFINKLDLPEDHGFHLD